MELKLWPWENGKEPYFTNEEGFDWYVDDETTKWCYRSTLNDLPKLEAVAFIVAKNNEALQRVLIDKKTNEPLYSTTKKEDMAVHIDWLRLVQKN